METPSTWLAIVTLAALSACDRPTQPASLTLLADRFDGSEWSDPVDGKELFFSSARAGSLGMLDIWRSTRRGWQDPWSTPVRLDPPINTAGFDQQPLLTRDGQTLIFTSDRPGGMGIDLWMSTRTSGGN